MSNVSVGSGRLDQKGHRKLFGDIGHNWVADTGVEDYDEPRKVTDGRTIRCSMSDRVRIQSVGITRGNSEVKPSQESVYVINATLRRIKERRGVVTHQERRGVVVTRKDGTSGVPKFGNWRCAYIAPSNFIAICKYNGLSRKRKKSLEFEVPLCEGSNQGAKINFSGLEMAKQGQKPLGGARIHLSQVATFFGHVDIMSAPAQTLA
ncbi:hypothetical protein C8R44DRAFT_753913 [Mycena epipterygia]|nr:hypothetical protein C8R44DRAFT_753913 [Mycena epipterygia]